MEFKIEDLTMKQIKEIISLGKCINNQKPKTERVPLPFKVGDAVLFRTVTMIDVGRVVAIGRDFITLKDGGWVADTGRFSEMLEKGTLNEFEFAKVPWFLVGRGAICDAFPWLHPLPTTTK